MQNAKCSEIGKNNILKSLEYLVKWMKKYYICEKKRIMEKKYYTPEIEVTIISLYLYII